MNTVLSMSTLLLLAFLPAVAAFPNTEVTTAQFAPATEEVTLLEARVANALASEERLTAENVQLQREIDGWQRVGARVMNREARIVGAMKQAREQPSASQASLRDTVLAGLSSATDPAPKPPLALATAETKSSGHLPGILVSWQLLVLAFTILAFAAFYYGRAPLSSFLSREKFVELSEMQLEGMAPGFGEGYLLVRPSGGLRSRTRAVEQRQGSSVMRFDEALTFSVKKGSGPCSIAIFRRGEVEDTRVGTALLQDSDLLGTAGHGSEAPSQYFRFKVQTESLSLKQELHVALRIRDVGSLASRNKARAAIV